ncbi:MAG: IS1595 family transposase [Acidobacteriaceae bacterium]
MGGMIVKQSIPKHLRFTMRDFNAQFPDDAACLAFLMDQKYPSGLVPCEKCGEDRKHYRLEKRPAYSCDHCGSHVYPMAGTIFQDSRTPLKTWFYAMFLMSATRCGISAKQIQRETGVTYKTAWRMFKQIRTLMSEDISLEGEAVELDEMYVGGKDRNKHVSKRVDSGRPGPNSPKTPVFGMCERGGRVIAKVTSDVKAKTIFPIVHERVLPSSTIYTDEYPVYDRLANETNGYVHHRVQHQQNIYVMGDAHTNSIEGFWSLVKRGIGGVYHSVSRKYLQSYLDEYSFRYNRRFSEEPMFVSLLDQVAERVN